MILITDMPRITLKGECLDELCNATNLIMSMKEKVVNEVKNYATDVLYDICENKAMNDGVYQRKLTG